MEVIQHPVITPLNNFIYNYSPENLAKHGLHTFYQHALANLPQLLGPAYLLVVLFYRRSFRLYSALSAIVVLSIFPHQEARFLIPAVPLLLSSVRLPPKFTRLWIAAWIVFNLIMGALMGTFHQVGVVPTQIHIARTKDIKHVFWWKTYSPPIWLLDGKIGDVKTTDLMGTSVQDAVSKVVASVPCGKKNHGVTLVAPASATALDNFTEPEKGQKGLILHERLRFPRHVSLDDMDFANDGVFPTLSRLFGRNGLVLWDVENIC